MCGIVGFVNRGINLSPLGENTLYGLKRAMAVQKHRGPDDDGACGFRVSPPEVYEEQNPQNLNKYGKFDGMFGFNRLSIKDLSIAGHQPMISQDKKVIIVFNGEIYNDEELRNLLKNSGGVQV